MASIVYNPIKLSGFVYFQRMLAEVVTEVKSMNKGLEKDTESEISAWSAATGPPIGRKVSFNREISVNQYSGMRYFLQYQH